MDIMKVKDNQGNWITVPAFQGQRGKTPSFSIGRVDLGTTPSSAAATITGTDEAPVLNLVLPKGINGDDGQDGATGPIGIAVQDTEPSEQLAWIDTSSTGNLVSLPEIKDGTVNTTDTWSSAKIRDFIYPIGSIYLSVNNVNPSTIFGGTWEQIQDTFLLAAGQTYNAGSTGGEAEHTLTTDEMPAHTHGNKTLTGKWQGVNKWCASRAAVAESNGIVTLTGNDNEEYTSPTNWTTNVSARRPGTVSIDASHEHTSVGSGQSHNNMPPYLAVYMWKRLS